MKNLFVAILVSLFASVSFAGTVYKVEPSQGNVEFATKGWPSLITIKGKGTGVSGELKEVDGKLSGELAFQLDTLKTGIDLRDNHMKDKYLEVKKFPKATLKIENMVVMKKADKKMAFKAKLMVHGVTKDIEGTYELTMNKDVVASIKAEIPLKLSDFKIEIPSYQGITVAEKVKINFSSKVKETKGKAASLAQK